MKEKKTQLIHIVLIILILLLGAGIFMELTREGIGWFSRETEVKPQRRGYIIIPSERQDVYLTETEDEYTVTCNLPGHVSKDNIKAEYDKGILTIRVPKIKAASEVKNKKVQVI